MKGGEKLVELNLERNEMLFLVLNLNIMRKNVKKGFKKRYGTGHKEMIARYDRLVNALPSLSENIDREEFEFLLDDPEGEMLRDFLSMYIERLTDDLGREPNEKEKESLNLLTRVLEKVN